MKKKLLFVCNANLLRSPSFENYFKKKYPNTVDAKSAGIYHNNITKEQIEWADIIYVMDISQEDWLLGKYMCGGKVRVIGVSDQYEKDSEEIKQLIRFWCWKEDWRLK